MAFFMGIFAFFLSDYPDLNAFKVSLGEADGAVSNVRPRLYNHTHSDI